MSRTEKKWFDRSSVESADDLEEKVKQSSGVLKFMDIDMYAVEEDGMREEDGVEMAFTVSSESIDRDDDVIYQSGWDLSDYRKNPVVLWAHDSSQPPVGRSTSIYVDEVENKLKSVAAFPGKDLYAFGNMIGRMYKNGFLRGASVGFMPTEFEMDVERDGQMPMNFRKQKLLEWSAVPVPSNPEGLAQARSFGIDTTPMVEWAEKILDDQKRFFIPKHMIEDMWKKSKPESVTTIGSVDDTSNDRAETEEKEVITKAIDVPSFISDNAKRGIAYYEDGFGGSGLVSRTISEARDMAAGTVTEDKLKRMAAWFKRHLSDLEAPQNNNSNHEDYPGAGAVAWLLWGGNPTSEPMKANDWADRKLAQIEDDKLVDSQSVEVKAVVPYDPHTKAPEDTEWNGPEEIAKASVEELVQMSTWYDADNPDVKSSYKLPHHKAGSYETVWRGVAAAMGALLGARGGVDIPTEDMMGVYEHLAEHYRQFGKEPPPFEKSLSVEESSEIESVNEIESTIEEESNGDSYEIQDLRSFEAMVLEASREQLDELRDLIGRLTVGEER